MAVVAVMDVTPEGRVAKYADFLTVDEANDHLVLFRNQYPNAFVVENETAPVVQWLVANKAVTVSVPPPPPPPPESEERQALRELAVEVGPQAVAKIDARFGVRTVRAVR